MEDPAGRNRMGNLVQPTGVLCGSITRLFEGIACTHYIDMALSCMLYIVWSVCWAHGWALQKQLNHLKSCLWANLCDSKELCIRYELWSPPFHDGTILLRNKSREVQRWMQLQRWLQRWCSPFPNYFGHSSFFPSSSVVDCLSLCDFFAFFFS